MPVHVTRIECQDCKLDDVADPQESLILWNKKHQAYLCQVCEQKRDNGGKEPAVSENAPHVYLHPDGVCPNINGCLDCF